MQEPNAAAVDAPAPPERPELTDSQRDDLHACWRELVTVGTRAKLCGNTPLEWIEVHDRFTDTDNLIYLLDTASRHGLTVHVAGRDTGYDAAINLIPRIGVEVEGLERVVASVEEAFAAVEREEQPPTTTNDPYNVDVYPERVLVSLPVNDTDGDPVCFLDYDNVAHKEIAVEIADWIGERAITLRDQAFLDPSAALTQAHREGVRRFENAKAVTA